MNNTSWETLYNECNECKKCSLCETKTNTVFGSGNKNATLMFIGEAPGEKRIFRAVRLSEHRENYSTNTLMRSDLTVRTYILQTFLNAVLPKTAILNPRKKMHVLIFSECSLNSYSLK